MSGLFRKATKATSKLRMALVGPSGSGKTFSALAVATGLTEPPPNSNRPPGRIAVIDTEHGSASLYSDRFAFDVVELAQFDPRNYIDVITAAEREGYDVLVIDSLSHAWSGKGGALEQVDAAARRSRSNNTFTAWRDVTPLHNALVDAILGSRCHIIATMRAKTEYAMEADPNTGKMTPRKIGMAPIQREGMDYEFTVVGDMDLDHKLVIGKTRCAMLDRAVIDRPGVQLARDLLGWLNDGASPAVVPQTVESLPADMVDEITRLVHETGMSTEQYTTALAKRGVSSVNRLTMPDAESLLGGLRAYAARIERDRAAQPAAASAGTSTGAPIASPATSPTGFLSAGPASSSSGSSSGSSSSSSSGRPIVGGSIHVALVKQATELVAQIPGYADRQLAGHLGCYGAHRIDELTDEDLIDFLGQLRDTISAGDANGQTNGQANQPTSDSKGGDQVTAQTNSPPNGEPTNNSSDSSEADSHVIPSVVRRDEAKPGKKTKTTATTNTTTTTTTAK